MSSSVPSPSEPQRPAGGALLATQCGRSASLVELLGALIKVTVIVGALTACGASVGPLRGGEQELVVMKKASVVLLRLIATRDGKPMDFLGKLKGTILDELLGEFVILAEDINTGDQLKVARPRAPTPQAAKEGWVYLVLEPGRYYLRVKPWPVSPVSGRFFLSVPAAGTVVYAGSLPFTCSHTGFLATMLECWPPVSVADESELAAHIAQTSFTQYGPFATILLQGPK